VKMQPRITRNYLTSRWFQSLHRGMCLG